MKTLICALCFLISANASANDVLPALGSLATRAWDKYYDSPAALRWKFYPVAVFYTNLATEALSRTKQDANSPITLCAHHAAGYKAIVAEVMIYYTELLNELSIDEKLAIESKISSVKAAGIKIENSLASCLIAAETAKNIADPINPSY